MTIMGHMSSIIDSMILVHVISFMMQKMYDQQVAKH